MPPRTRSALPSGDVLTFTTKKRKKTAIDFMLDGEKFVFTPPKEAMMILPVIDGTMTEVSATKLAFDWLGEGLGEKQTERLISRLRDPKDDLDVDSLVGMVRSLSEKAGGGRPTT